MAKVLITTKQSFYIMRVGAGIRMDKKCEERDGGRNDRVNSKSIAYLSVNSKSIAYLSGQLTSAACLFLLE